MNITGESQAERRAELRRYYAGDPKATPPATGAGRIGGGRTMAEAQPEHFWNHSGPLPSIRSWRGGKGED